MRKQVKLENIIEATVPADMLKQKPMSSLLWAATELDESRKRVADISRQLATRLLGAADHIEVGGNLIPSDFLAGSTLEQLQREIGRLEATQTMVNRLGRVVLGRELWDDVLKAYEKAVKGQREKLGL